MYKITKNSQFSFVEIKNPNEIFEPFNFTNLEKELRECVDNQFNQTIFFNSEIPNCETKFWKISNEMETFIERVPDYYDENNKLVFKDVTYSFNKIVEMTQEEKAAVDLAKLAAATQAEYRGFKYRIKCINSKKAIKEVAGVKDLLLIAEFSPAIDTGSEKVGTGSTQTFNLFAYVNFIDGEDDKTNPAKEWAQLHGAKFADNSPVFKVETNDFYTQ